MRIKAWVQTNVSGSKIVDYYDVPDHWDELTPEQQEDALDEFAQEHLTNNADFGACLEE